MNTIEEKKLITTQPCKVRGCKNKSYILYPLDGIEKKPICRDCLKRMIETRQELKFREFQLRFNFGGRW